MITSLVIYCHKETLQRQSDGYNLGPTSIFATSRNKNLTPLKPNNYGNYEVSKPGNIHRGLPDFSSPTYQNGEKVPNCHTYNLPNDNKIYQMAIK
jgi:hypothetical protein